MRHIIAGQGPFGEKVLEALLKKGEDVVGVFTLPDKRGEAMKELAERSKVRHEKIAAEGCPATIRTDPLPTARSISESSIYA